MNGGVIGLLLVALALGMGVGACWRYGTTYLTRWAPGLLALAYYLASFVWPHPAWQAMTARHPYPETEQVRPLLLGLALLLVVVELVARLHRAVQNNDRLRAEVARLKGERRDHQ